MRIFITGASGYIGYTVAKAFRAKGHQVHGLVRNKEDANLLKSEEIWPIMGDLGNFENYRQILDEVEVAVHCAFDSSSPEGVMQEEKCLDNILASFSKSPLPRAIIYTSGVWVYGSLGHKIADESMSLKPLELVKWRPSHEEKILKATNPKLRTVVLRPGHVYGGVGGLTKLLFSSTEEGAVSIVGEGFNHWPMIHVKDLAHAYVSAAEKEVSNVILNVVDDSNSTLRELAESIAKAANMEGKIHVISTEDAKNKYGPLFEGLQIDLIVDNSRVKRLLGWQIHHAPFIYEADLYYQAWLAQQSQEF